MRQSLGCELRLQPKGKIPGFQCLQTLTVFNFRIHTSSISHPAMLTLC